jgi:hypothetical protein
MMGKGILVDRNSLLTQTTANPLIPPPTTATRILTKAVCDVMVWLNGRNHIRCEPVEEVVPVRPEV